MLEVGDDRIDSLLARATRETDRALRLKNWLEKLSLHRTHTTGPSVFVVRTLFVARPASDIWNFDNVGILQLLSMSEKCIV